MAGIFGNSGSIQQGPTTSNITPAQAQLQSILAGQAGTTIPSLIANVQAGRPAVPPPYGGQFAAPASPTELGLIGDIVNTAAPGGASAGTIGNAQNALTQILTGQPQDFSQYFTTDIAGPLENTFSQRTLPAIKAAFARSAGGATTTGGDTGGMNTGMTAAVGQATQDLDQQLQQSITSLGTSAETQASQQRVQGVTLAPSIAGAGINDLTSALTAAGLPRNIEQAQISGEQGQANTALNFLSSLFGTGSGLASSGTQQGNVAAFQPTAGITPGIMDLVGLLGSAAIIASDPRVKDIKGKTKNTALETLKKLKVKDAKYKWEPPGLERPMLMADNVRKVYPNAAVDVGGLGYIKPADLIPLLIKGVQELAKAA